MFSKLKIIFRVLQFYFPSMCVYVYIYIYIYICVCVCVYIYGLVYECKCFWKRQRDLMVELDDDYRLCLCYLIYIYLFELERIYLNRQEINEVWTPLVNPLFWNLSIDWSVYVIIYSNPEILPVCWILSKLKVV